MISFGGIQDFWNFLRLLVNKNNHYEMVDKIIQLINDSNFSSNISLAARKKSLTFSAEKIIPEWNKLIDEII